MKKLLIALAASVMAAAAFSAPVTIPDALVGKYVAKGEKCDVKPDGKFKAESYLLVTKSGFEQGFLNEAEGNTPDYMNCKPLKSTGKGDVFTFPASCAISMGKMKKTFSLAKQATGVGLTNVSDGAPVISYIACPAK